MDDDLVIVGEAEDEIELLLIRQLLEEAGIRCNSGYTTQAAMVTGHVQPNFRDIQVLAPDAVQAEQLIADFRADAAAGALALEESEPSVPPEEPATSPDLSVVLVVIISLLFLPIFIHFFMLLLSTVRDWLGR